MAGGGEHRTVADMLTARWVPVGCSPEWFPMAWMSNPDVRTTWSMLGSARRGDDWRLEDAALTTLALEHLSDFEYAPGEARCS